MSEFPAFAGGKCHVKFPRKVGWSLLEDPLVLLISHFRPPGRLFASYGPQGWCRQWASAISWFYRPLVSASARRRVAFPVELSSRVGQTLYRPSALRILINVSLLAVCWRGAFGRRLPLFDFARRRLRFGLTATSAPFFNSKALFGRCCLFLVHGLSPPHDVCTALLYQPSACLGSDALATHADTTIASISEAIMKSWVSCSISLGSISTFSVTRSSLT